jgi:hypothetical protein
MGGHFIILNLKGQPIEKLMPKINTKADIYSSARTPHGVGLIKNYSRLLFLQPAYCLLDLSVLRLQPLNCLFRICNASGMRMSHVIGLSVPFASCCH